MWSSGNDFGYKKTDEVVVMPMQKRSHLWDVLYYCSFAVIVIVVLVLLIALLVIVSIDLRRGRDDDRDKLRVLEEIRHEHYEANNVRTDINGAHDIFVQNPGTFVKQMNDWNEKITEKTKWTNWGNGLYNTRNAFSEHKINNFTVQGMGLKWKVELGERNGVSATPAVDETGVYFPDWAGQLYRMDKDTGKIIWQVNLTQLLIQMNQTQPAPYPTGILLGSRTTPILDEEHLYVATQALSYMLCLRKRDGVLRWATKTDLNRFAMLTESGTLYNGILFGGVSSNEEAAAALVPGYECCSFVGSAFALNATNGQFLWKTYMTTLSGFYGMAIWGSSPSIDTLTNTVFYSSGNNYKVPREVEQCHATRTACLNAGGGPSCGPSCNPPGNHQDALMALDMYTGSIKWVYSMDPYDAWTVACIIPGSPSIRDNCPSVPGGDYDFGQSPMLFTAMINGEVRRLMGAGEKSGIFWALDRDSGEIVWSTQVGPGGYLGGMEWGSATDGQRIYVANANSLNHPLTLPNGTTIYSGSWAALDINTGNILWQTPVPGAAFCPPCNSTQTPSAFNAPGCTCLSPSDPSFKKKAEGPVTIANGVLFGGSDESDGGMYALDAATGTILWSYRTGSSVYGGPSVVDGVVYWGTGYGKFGVTGGGRIYAFHLVH
jgi:polyvinyl alcohol dehydrogenase (cytochrome)